MTLEGYISYWKLLDSQYFEIYGIKNHVRPNMSNQSLRDLVTMDD